MCWNTRFRERKIMFVLSTISVARTNEPIKTTEPKPRLISIKKVHIIILLVGAVCTQSLYFVCPSNIARFAIFQKTTEKLAHRPFGSDIFIANAPKLCIELIINGFTMAQKRRRKKNSSKCWQMNWVKWRNFLMYSVCVPCTHSPHSQTKCFCDIWHNLATVCHGPMGAFVIHCRRSFF